MTKSPSDSDHAQPTHTVEDYLLTMHVMERDQGEIVAARVAEVLNITPATVAMTLKRMERDNWITSRSRRESIHLTEDGRAAAHSVIRRHMLTEWLLLKILKVPFLQIHAEAHNMEHAISAQLEERLIDILDNPQTCPHGNPFPGYEEATSHWIPLIEIAAGEQAIIRRLHEFAEDNQDLLKFLYENGIVTGAKITVTEVLPFNQTMTLMVGGRTVTLGFTAARSLFVEKD